MKYRIRKVLALGIIVTLLVGGMPVNYTKAAAIINQKTIDKELTSTIKKGGKPKPVNTKLQSLQSDTNPSDYKLVSNNEVVDTLYDSYYENQTIGFEEVADVDATTMGIKILSQSEYAYSKDRYTYIELFTDNAAGSLDYIGYTYFDTYEVTNISLASNTPKSWYEGKQYIYIRVGLADSLDSAQYSAVTQFKVINPFYVGQPPVDGQSVVISNESVDSSTTQSTGTLPIAAATYNMPKNLSLEAYKMDVAKPFNGKISKVQPKQNAILQDVIGSSKLFWVSDFRDSSESQISADLMYSGTKAKVWVNNSQISASDAIAIGKEFDANIYGKITESFGLPSDVDNDGKVNILCYDIQDGFSSSGSYIGGYFYGGDLNNTQYSNNTEIFYIDTYPAMGTASTKQVSNCYGTLAHEFQHMINYNQNIFVENNSANMDTWLNEALSEAASQVYTGKVSQGRIDYYNASSQIAQGASLLKWQSDRPLENYSLSYLFSQYIKKQVGIGDKVFKEIIQSPYNDYRSVEQVIKKYISPTLTFGQFMTNFRAAMVLKEPTGAYGFKGDTAFDTVKTPIYNGTRTDLYGGGAVVKVIKATTTFTQPSDKGSSIRCLVLAPELYDINGDGVLDVMDLALLGQAYNAKVGDNLYTSNLDFNKDNIIDLFDLVKMTKKF